MPVLDMTGKKLVLGDIVSHWCSQSNIVKRYKIIGFKQKFVGGPVGIQVTGENFDTKGKHRQDKIPGQGGITLYQLGKVALVERKKQEETK